jgi:hypothetical protein
MPATLTDEELLAAIGGGSPTNMVDAGPSNVTRINFGNLKEKPKATGKTEYPVLPDPNGEIAQLADQFLKQHAAETAAKGAKEVARGQLVSHASPFHWSTNCGRQELQGTVSVAGKTGEVLVQFKNAYKAIADVKDKAGNLVQSAEDRAKAIPPDIFAKYFRQTFSIEIDSTKIQDDKLQAVVDKLQALAVELGITDAVNVSAAFMPVESFHTDRYRVLTAEQNMQIEVSMGEKGLMTVAVTSAKGRKK